MTLGEFREQTRDASDECEIIVYVEGMLRDEPSLAEGTIRFDNTGIKHIILTLEGHS